MDLSNILAFGLTQVILLIGLIGVIVFYVMYRRKQM